MKKSDFRTGLAAVLLLACCFLASPGVRAQTVIRKSDKTRPAWLTDKTPKTTNSTFHYQLAEAESETLEGARQECLTVLSRYIGQSWKISGEAETDIRTEDRNGQINTASVYNFHYKIKDEEISVTSTKYDEYWEYIYYPGGSRYHCYVLFGVADTPVPQFDRLRFTRKYGARGMMRSLIVPGWGQMYKGSTVKGLCILGGEVALAAGIIVSENLRSSYVKKMHEQPKHQQTYNTRADNWENVRNACIGGAAVLYVYNLIDAIVANGRKRAVVQKPVSFAMYILRWASVTAKDVVDTTGSLYGIVNDADNGEPVSGVLVALSPGGKSTNTGSDGCYEFPDLDAGQYTVQVSKAGYKTNTKRISVVAGGEVSGDMQLERGESRIKLSVSSLTFAKGETSKTFEVMNVGTSGSVSWNIPPTVSWLSFTPASGSTGQGKNSAVVLTLSREKITKDETANLLVEADGASVPLEVNVLFGDKEEGGEGGGEGGSDKKGSCKEITSCDSEVKIEFLSCLKNADTVEFLFTMTNNREDWRVWFNRDKSGSLDDKGNSYSGSYTKVYVGDSNTFVTGGSSVSFLKGAKVKCRVVIPGIKDEAVYLQRWEWIISSSEPWNPQTKKVTFAEVKW